MCRPFAINDEPPYGAFTWADTHTHTLLHTLKHTHKKRINLRMLA